MGASTSSEVKGHQKSNLCNKRETVYNEIQLLDKARDTVVRHTKIMIVNESSKYLVVHSNHGDSCGYFFSDVQSEKKPLILLREDGVSDENAKIAGYGITPTGVVDIDSLASQVKHATSNNPFHSFNVQCGCFKVKCEFENKFVSEFIFTVTDLK